MLYVILNEAGFARSATAEYTQAVKGSRVKVECRCDWKTFARAEEVAAQLTEATGVLYIGVDRGSNTSPQFDVIAAPTVGAKVSKAFNGDSYIAGEIVKISKTLKRIETSTGEVFFRRRQSSSWVEGGTWSLQMGHHEIRNPSF